MIQLNEYIVENEIENDILNRIYFHTCVEFKLTHNLYPYSINENYGKFDNAGKVVKHIVDVLKERCESQVIDCSDDNVYFKFINININSRYKWYAQYKKYDNDTVYINICTSQNNFNENIDIYVKLIIHELLHGYEDYNRIKNTGQGIFACYNEKYKKSFGHLNSQNDIKQVLSRCNYFLNDKERNAYLSQIETDIESIFKNEHIKIEDFNYTEFKDKLKNTDIWKEYFKLSSFILKLNNSEYSNDQKQYIEDTWNQLYNEKKTFNQINKELYNKWLKFERKFEQLVPKIICKYIETNIKEVAFSIIKLSEDDYWKNII